MHTPIGKTVWAFADLFWPKVDNGQDYVTESFGSNSPYRLDVLF